MDIPPINRANFPADSGHSPLSSAIDRVFLADMLKRVSTFSTGGSFSGGVGEEQFASFLAEAYADKIAERIKLGVLHGSVAQIP